MVLTHNAVRADAIPIPMAPLALVTWSSTLQTTAQAWANVCSFTHSGVPGLGENLFASSSTVDPVPRPDPATVLANWGSEKAFYNYAGNSCTAPPIPGTCGHYTQVIWRSSVLIGCGIKECLPATSPFPPPFNTHNWYIWVCQYSPAGNVGGERPYLCDYDLNGTFESVCDGRGIFVDSYEVGIGRWSAKTP